MHLQSHFATQGTGATSVLLLNNLSHVLLHLCLFVYDMLGQVKFSYASFPSLCVIYRCTSKKSLQFRTANITLVFYLYSLCFVALVSMINATYNSSSKVKKEKVKFWRKTCPFQ